MMGFITKWIAAFNSFIWTDEEYLLSESEFDNLRRLYIAKETTPEQEYAYFSMIASGHYDDFIAKILDEACTPSDQSEPLIIKVPDEDEIRYFHEKVQSKYRDMLRIRQENRRFNLLIAQQLLMIICCCIFFFNPYILIPIC